MKLLILQLLTSLTATGMITFTVTHMHQDYFHLEAILWAIHWITAWPIAFVTIRWISPVYQKFINRFY